MDHPDSLPGHGFARLLLLACAALALIYPCTGLRAQNHTISEQYLLMAANAERQARGLPPVQLDPGLERAALYHARQMAMRGTISHQFTGEPDLAERAGDAGAKFSLVTENVAEASNSALIHDLWMKSEGHRANLLDGKVNAIGIAVVQQHGQLYAVEDFARTVEQLSLSDQEATVAALVAQNGLSILVESADARQTCSMATGYVGRQPWFVMRYTSASLDRLPEELTERMATGKYRRAAVGACSPHSGPFTSYNLAVLLYP